MRVGVRRGRSIKSHFRRSPKSASAVVPDVAPRPSKFPACCHLACVADDLSPHTPWRCASSKRCLPRRSRPRAPRACARRGARRRPPPRGVPPRGGRARRARSVVRRCRRRIVVVRRRPPTPRRALVPGQLPPGDPISSPLFYVTAGIALGVAVAEVRERRAVPERVPDRGPDGSVQDGLRGGAGEEVRGNAQTRRGGARARRGARRGAGALTQFFGKDRPLLVKNPPAYLDGELPGDYGFDPLGFAAPRPTTSDDATANAASPPPTKRSRRSKRPSSETRTDLWTVTWSSSCCTRGGPCSRWWASSCPSCSRRSARCP